MKVYLTEQAATVSLSEEEVQSLVEGKEVVGSPDTGFLSPFGMRIVIVAKEKHAGAGHYQQPPGRQVESMKLTPEEEAIFDEKYQELVDAYESARDWLISHKQEMKNLVEKVKDHMQ